MADDDNTPPKRTKKKGLPPISPKGSDDINNSDVRPVKRRVKKKVSETDTNGISSQVVDENKPTPRRRRKRSPSQGKDGAEDNEKTNVPSTTTTPRKKKKKPKAEDANQSAETGSQSKDPQGSKTSLISKDGGTPRKKAGKKKKKGAKISRDGDEFGESPWAEDLRGMKEDIISGEEKEEGEGEVEETSTDKKKPSYFTSPILRSQPLDKIFIETSSKFKGQSKSVLSRQLAEETAKPIAPEPVARTTIIEFALGSHKIFRVVTLFLHGLTAGLALWQMVTIFFLTTFPNDDFLEHYYQVSMPLQSSYYFLLAMITVSACDRFDIGNPTRRSVLRALTMQNGTVSIVFCLVALILNQISIRYDDRMYLYKDYPDLYASESKKSDEIDAFRGINTARSVFIILSWFVLSITPNSDRLGKNLRSGGTGLEQELEMDKVSTA